MDNFIRYCCDKGLHNFMDFKIERKSRIVMKEHFVSNKDVKKYDLAPFVQPDRFGRYKIPKFLSRKLSHLISDCMSGYLVYDTDSFGTIKRKLTIKDVEKLFLNPSGEVAELLGRIKEDLDKDVVRNRIIKIWNIKNKMKNHE